MKSCWSTAKIWRWPSVPKPASRSKKRAPKWSAPAATLLFSAEEAHRLHGEVVPMDASPGGKGRWAMTVREPLGVIGAITPFNFPLNLAMHKIGPALAGGNAVVHKPASTTPISAIKMAAIFAECGLPKGALNVITGPGGAIGDLLVFDPRVAMITFTGSVDVGLRIRNLAGMKRVTLELGSNSAVIIEDDANLDEAVPRCVAGSFAHSGPGLHLGAADFRATARSATNSWTASSREPASCTSATRMIRRRTSAH